MKKYVVILLFFLIAKNICAQYYNYAYNVDTYVYPHSSGNYDQYNLEICTDLIVEQDFSVCACLTNSPTWVMPVQVNSVIVLLNDSGNVINDIEIFTDSTEIFRGINILKSGQDYILTGNAVIDFYSPDAKFVGLVSRLDSNLQLESSTYFDFGDYTTFGLSTLETNAAFYMLGFADVDTSNNTNTDFFVSKFDKSLVPIDTFQFGGLYNETPTSMQLLENENLLVSGYKRSANNATGLDLFLYEIDTAGNLIWSQEYGGPGDERTQGGNTSVDQYGNIYLTGYTELMDGNIAAWFVKVDSVGNLIWDKKFDRGVGFDAIYDITMVNQEYFVVAGATLNYDLMNTPPNGWLVKIDTAGSILWERSISKYGNILGTQDYFFGLHLDSKGNIFTNGYILRGINDDNGIYRDNDGWIWKGDSCGYSQNNPTQALFVVDSIIGQTVYITNLSDNYCTGFFIVQDNNGNVMDTIDIYAYSEWTTGVNSEQILLVLPDTGIYEIAVNVTGGDSTSIYSTAIEYNDTATHINDRYGRQMASFSVYPNPTNSTFILSLDGNNNSDAIQGEVYDVQGREVFDFEMSPNLKQMRIDLPKLDDGVYFIKLRSSTDIIGVQKISVVN